jgi:protein SPT2
MDDFIDDSDVPAEDISNMIGQLFGYNKRKFANEDSDDDCMESSVEQQMREEARTLRLGQFYYWEKVDMCITIFI